MLVEIFTDGSCPFCLWVRARVEPYDALGQLKFLDYNNPAIAAATPFAHQELAREMHVRTRTSPEDSGSWSVGFFGWLAILKVLPRWKWLGLLLSAPPLRWMGPPVYRLVAANRYQIPGIPKPCDTFCRVPEEEGISRQDAKTPRT